MALNQRPGKVIHSMCTVVSNMHDLVMSHAKKFQLISGSRQSQPSLMASPSGVWPSDQSPLMVTSEPTSAWKPAVV